MDNVFEKKFCVLEQGKFVGEALTQKHHLEFNTTFSDFYRLNWFADKDPLANFYAKNITLSEGKNLLYQSIPKKYEYYIFIDDDVNLETMDGSDIAEKIRDILTEYKPLHGTFFRKPGAKWGAWHVADIINIHREKNKDAWPIYGFDLDCDIYHWSYIKNTFPIRHHGCYQCLGYTQYICYKLYQDKQMMFDQIRIANTRQGNHLEEKKLPQSIDSIGLTQLFLKELLPNNINRDAKFIFNNVHIIPKINHRLYMNSVNKNEVIFQEEDMKKILR